MFNPYFCNVRTTVISFSIVIKYKICIYLVILTKLTSVLRGHLLNFSLTAKTIMRTKGLYPIIANVIRYMECHEIFFKLTANRLSLCTCIPCTFYSILHWRKKVIIKQTRIKNTEYFRLKPFIQRVTLVISAIKKSLTVPCRMW